MINKILNAMTEAISVLSVLEKTYVMCCVVLVVVDRVIGLTPQIFQFGYVILIAAFIPVFLAARKTQKNISALLAGLLLVSIYMIGQGYLAG